MVRKSMGSFIAALRKANGMTQADLADKLSVSDKTVSRWERGEGAPDLSLIPIIAHIFQVTSDELLRGERNSSVHDDNPKFDDKLSKRGQRQLKRLLKINLSKARNQSLISIGIMVTGLIAAMICNFGYNRGYLGFFVAAFFFMTGILYEIIITNIALLKVSDDEFEGKELNCYRQSVSLLIRRVLLLGVVFFAITLPLILTGDPLFGVMGRSWLKLGLLYGAIALALCLVISDLWDFILIRKRIYTLGEKENDIYLFNLDLKKKYGLILTGILVITLGAHWFISRKAGKNEEDFLADIINTEITSYEERVYQGDTSDRENRVLHTYVNRQEGVTGPVIYDGKRGFFPFTIYTYRKYAVGSVPWGKIIMVMPNIGFFLVYLVEIGAIVAIYYRKRAKIQLS